MNSIAERIDLWAEEGVAIVGSIGAFVVLDSLGTEA